MPMLMLGRSLGRAAKGPPAGSGPTLLADMDWGTATGSTQAALLDENNATPFDQLFCPTDAASCMAVVTGITGSTTTNVMEITARGETICGQAAWSDLASPIPPSTSHYGLAQMKIEAGFISNHGCSYKVIDMEIIPWRINTTGGGVLIGPSTFRNGAGGSISYPNNWWTPGVEGQAGDRTLASDTWFYYAWYIEYLTATTYRLYPRLYNAAGTLLYDSTSFYPINETNCTTSLQDWYDAGNTLGILNADDATEFAVGYEGPSGASDTGLVMHIAPVQFSTDGWLTP